MQGTNYQEKHKELRTASRSQIVNKIRREKKRGLEKEMLMPRKSQGQGKQGTGKVRM